MIILQYWTTRFQEILERLASLQSERNFIFKTAQTSRELFCFYRQSAGVNLPRKSQ